MCRLSKKGEKVDCRDCNCSDSLKFRPGGHVYYITGRVLYCRNCDYSGW